jgi:hypothetical protein
VYVVPTQANPNNYPQFAQQDVDPAIPIFFTGVERVKAQLDAGHPPMLVDVRSVEEYNAGHLPRAKSIPLEVLPRRWPRSRAMFQWSCIEAVRTIWPVWPIRNCIALDIGTCKCSTRACQAGSSTSIRWMGSSASHSSPSKLCVTTGWAGAFA